MGTHDKCISLPYQPKGFVIRLFWLIYGFFFSRKHTDSLVNSLYTNVVAIINRVVGKCPPAAASEYRKYSLRSGSALH